MKIKVQTFFLIMVIRLIKEIKVQTFLLIMLIMLIRKIRVQTSHDATINTCDAS
jgi:hypothetical protein